MPSFLERILLLPSALLALSISQALASTVHARDTQSSTVPAPISILPNDKWEGIDGSWSAFNVQIGTPPQEIQTFVSWSVYQTWAVIEQGCALAASPSACAKTRGEMFDESASTTFNRKGTSFYNLWVGRPLGLYGNAIFGFDTVTLQGPDGNGPSLNDTLVAGFAQDSFWIGMFGINPKPTNFSGFSNGSPSYMTSLKEQKSIPSVSFGYTAGAQYRSDTSYASLTLGGYDTSKFIKNDITWVFAPDNSRDIVVAITSIHTPATDPSNPVATELLPSAIYAYMDALVAEIWLPIEACQVFESVFGLQYDNYTELYLVNQTHHQTLVNRNASITFELGISTDSAETVSIELPYAAFDLTAQKPYQSLASNSSYYFPLRRAANESQYWIGRTFFQEAYISVDYERQRFNVSQRNWDASSPTHIVAIPEYTGESAVSGSPGTSSSSLSGGAIAGIVVGAIAVVVLLGLLLVWLFRRRSLAARRADRGEKLDSDAGSTNNASPSRRANNASPSRGANNASPSTRGLEPNVFPKAELEGSAVTPPVASGALSSNDSGSGAGTPRTAQHLSGATFVNPRNFSISASPTTDSPEEGTGTHSSTDSRGGNSSSGTNGTGTVMSSIISPISPPEAASEADSKERDIHEMPADAPTIREKDGKELTEKEACAHREKLYNGVESPIEPLASVPNFSRSSLQGPRRINPEDVTTSNEVLGLESERRDYGMHRAFSFEEERPSPENTEELYQRS